MNHYGCHRCQDEYPLGIHQNFDVLVYIGRVQESRNLLTDNPGKPRKGRESPQFIAVGVLPVDLDRSRQTYKTGRIYNLTDLVGKLGLSRKQT